MNQPEFILENDTRVRTHESLNGAGMMINSRHMVQRRPNTLGVICGIVGGHGGDVYWVGHLGDPCVAAYSWDEFELEPAKDPCPACRGTGLEPGFSACPACGGSAEYTGPPDTAWQRLTQDPA